MRCVDLLGEHHGFDDALRRVRTDVHRGLGDPAPMRWLDGALRRHIAVEEAHLLPAFDRLDHPVPNGAPDVFRRDHRLILGHLDAIAAGWDDPVLRAEGLGRLAGVLDHHDRREARYLLPRLDQEVAPDVVASWFADHPALDRAPVAAGGVEPRREVPDGGPLDRARWWVATGQVEAALGELPALTGISRGKGPRLVEQVRASLEAGDPVAAWDALALVAASARAGRAG